MSERDRYLLSVAVLGVDVEVTHEARGDDREGLGELG
jgi:hypothetical protein